MKDLRRLDFDDLWLLSLLLEGRTLVSIAALMKVSQPAISQRLRKVEQVFLNTVCIQKGRRLILTDEGVALAERAKAALKLLQDSPSSKRPGLLYVGTRPEVGASWLAKAVFQLRRTHPELCIHIQVGSGNEILQALSAGQLDAVLTSTPFTIRDFRSIDLVREDYVFVAKAGLLPPRASWRDLQQCVLIEYDRSLPFLRYMKPADRAKAQFKDVWFLGSTTLMVAAVEAGHGVGIVPSYLVQESLRKGRLKPIECASRPGSDNFRLIVKADPHIETRLKILADTMRNIGLQ